MIEKNHNGEHIEFNGRTIGWLEDGVFYKEVKGSKHQLRKRVWYIYAEPFDKEIKPYATELIITNIKTGTKWRVSVEKFDHMKEELGRGHDKKYYLSPAYWEIEVKGISVV
jgi:hypothetical protein